MKTKVQVKTIDSIVSALRNKNNVTNQEYQKVYRHCKRVSGRAFDHYGMNSIVYNPSVKEDIIEDIATISLVKAIKGYNPNKNAKFFTYYFNKVRSYTRAHAGKAYRRRSLLNASSLDEYTKEGQDD
jgi:hypothetical protein